MIGKKLERIKISEEKCIEFIKRDFQRARGSYYSHKEYTEFGAMVFDHQSLRIRGYRVVFYFKQEIIAKLFSNELIFFRYMSNITEAQQRAVNRTVDLLKTECQRI